MTESEVDYFDSKFIDRAFKAIIIRMPSYLVLIINSRLSKLLEKNHFEAKLTLVQSQVRNERKINTVKEYTQKW